MRRPDLVRDYAEDLALFEDRRWMVAAVLAFAACVGFVLGPAPDYAVFVTTRIALFVIAAIGLNLLMGYAGQISLGHAAFLAIGAYTHTILYTKGAPLLVGALAGAAVAGAFGFIVGIPSLRLEGPYLAISTLGFQVAVDQLLGRWESLTGGRMGLPVPAPEIFVELSSRAYAVLSIVVTTLVIIGAYNLTRSRIGRAFVAIRDNETAAESMGVNLVVYKTMAFAISAAITGLAGALLVHQSDSINPSNFTLLTSIELLVMIMVGGLASILGSVLGASLLVTLEHTLTAFADYQTVAIGTILILVILFEPMGLRGRWLRMRLYFKAWPF
ncbi:MAG: branched-chain amino acid ABC transporter permease [Deltaproteobacteria bacterium]|jgi:branched-chain amino acid transport system permease protein